MDEKRKRDTRGRKIATSERRAELLAAFDASGLTQRAFARREGVNFVCDRPKSPLTDPDGDDPGSSMEPMT